MPLDFVLLASTDLTDESQTVYIYKAKHIKSQIYRYMYKLHNMTICDSIITPLSERKEHSSFCHQHSGLYS